MADLRERTGRVAGVVLAAGAGRRFGGGKLLALLDGRPLIRHSVDALREAGIGEIVVVVPPGDAGMAIARASGGIAVVNPSPAEGLASSVRVGVHAGAALDPAVDMLVVALGDQPRLRPQVIAALLRHAAHSRRPIVVPRYASDEGRNPVVLVRAAFGLVEGLSGDRGLDPLLRGHPDLVDEVPVDGSNPDVDTPADLVALTVASR